MDKRIQKYLIYLNGLFAITATLGQVITIQNHWVIFAVFLPNVLAWICFFFIYRRLSPPLPSNAAIRALGSRLDTDELTFRHIRTKVELEQIWLIDSRIYRDENISKEALYDWYGKFSKGAFVMYQGVKFLGYVGIYPLKRTSFDNIKAGLLKEDRMNSSDFYGDNEARNCRTWYFSGIALDKSGEEWLDQLMSKTFFNWAKWFDDGEESIEAISFAYPGPDAYFLKEVGFYELRPSHTEHELPIVGKVFDKPEIIRMARRWSNDNEDFTTDLALENNSDMII